MIASVFQVMTNLLKQDAWPGRSLRSISKKDVVAVTGDEARSVAGVTAGKVAKSFVAWCEAREDDFASPARSIRKPAKEKSRDRVLDENELKLTWEAADAEGGAAGALVKLLILSGARRNEMTELARDEIKTEVIELPGERTKNGLPHTIPITPMIQGVLHSQPRTSTFVLNGTDRPFGDHSGAKERVAPEIRPWTLHDLRRSFASGLQRLAWLRTSWTSRRTTAAALSVASPEFTSDTVMRRKRAKLLSYGQSTLKR